jgi:predicted Fe-S protein YdhL (DUF1289 family)
LPDDGTAGNERLLVLRFIARMNIASPCIHVCRLNGEVCAGCHRTRDEIAGWLQMTDGEKAQVKARLAECASEGEAVHE